MSINQDWAEAKANGEKHYQGQPCNKCGGTWRYVSNRGCVACLCRKAGKRPAMRPVNLVRLDRLLRERDPVIKEVWEDDL